MRCFFLSAGKKDPLRHRVLRTLLVREVWITEKPSVNRLVVLAGTLFGFYDHAIIAGTQSPKGFFVG